MTCMWSEISAGGLKNGELLKRSAGRIDVFLTADQNLQYQQNLRNLPVAVIVLIAKTNRIQDVRPLIPRLLEELAKLAPQTLVRIAR
jgi:hypothetical protein